MCLLVNLLIEWETYLHLTSSLNVITSHRSTPYYNNNRGLGFYNANTWCRCLPFCAANSFSAID